MPFPLKGPIEQELHCLDSESVLNIIILFALTLFQEHAWTQKYSWIP